MASVDDLEIEVESIEETVRPAKIDFRDDRMNNIVCPLCSSAMRLVRAEDHSFGEFGMWQCDDCGTIIDICNMVDKPALFDLLIKELGDGFYPTLRTSLKQHGHFEKMQFEVSKSAVKNEKENARLDKLEAQVKCYHCEERFNPAPSAKSMLTLEYCPKCRREESVRSEVVRREAEAKELAKIEKNKARARAKSKAKKPVKRKVA